MVVKSDIYRGFPEAARGWEMPDYSRRRFLQYGLGAGAAIGFPATAGRAVKAGRVADADRAGGAGHSLKRFVERLPVPGAGVVVASPRAPGR